MNWKLGFLQKRGGAVGGWVVVLLTLAAFLPALRGEFLLWDDDGLLVQNTAYRGLSAARWHWMCTTVLIGHWQPLTWLSYAIDYLLYGLDARAWHGTNLLLHAVNAWLVYRLCLWFKRDDRFRSGSFFPVAAVLAALFWSVHPLRVEPVAWLSTRGYLLCGTFCLLATHQYFRAVHAGRYPLSALLFFALATATKGIGMMLPLAWLLADGFPLRRIVLGHRFQIATAARLLFEKLPFFALSLVAGGMSFYAKKIDGGMVPVHLHGPLGRMGQALSGIWFYLAKTVSPQNLSPIYDRWPGTGKMVLAVVFSMLAIVLLACFRRRLKPVAVTGGMFVLLIFPMLGIAQSGAQVFADRFTYLASIPVSVGIAAALSRVIWLRRTVFYSLALLLGVFLIQSAVYTGVWSNSLRFWHYVLRDNPESERAFFGIGHAWKESGDCERALVYFNLALERNPSFAAALSNRATCRLQLGDVAGALEDYHRALQDSSLRPDDRATLLILRAGAAGQAGDTEQALLDLTHAAALADANPQMRIRSLMRRAVLLVSLERAEEARADVQRALRLPDVTGEYHPRLRQALELMDRGQNPPDETGREEAAL